jgi:hypothetical protein
MKELKINIPEGKEIDLKKSNLEKGEIFFKNKEYKLPTQMHELTPPESFWYYLRGWGVQISNDSNEYDHKDVIHTKELAEAFMALIELLKFRDAWNQGWKYPADTTITAYIIYNDNNRLYCRTSFSCNAPLAFKTKELRDKFLETFRDKIEKALPLL